MGQVIDNLIAYRVLSMLVKPFVETDAFKLGIIDDKGTNLIKARDFTTQEQKDAYNYLQRLVFNMKKLINKLPGGESKLKNLVAAFFLIREAYQTRTIYIAEEKLNDLVAKLDEGIILAEAQLIVEDFMRCEDGEVATTAPANVTGANVSTDIPVIRKSKKRRFAAFTVNDDVFKRFANGKSKGRKWAEYLNLEDEGQKSIYDYARKNPNGVIVLHNGKDKKAIRFNRTGGGSWSKLKRPTRQINNVVT